jgi:branched-chain amino acid transport system substrate-binding protein
VLKDKVSVLGDNSKVKFVGPDGIQTQSFIDEAGSTNAEGVYASVAGRPLYDLTEAGQQFVKDYEAEYGVLKEPYALNGYEAMNVLLKAIENVCEAGGDASDRETVRAAVFAIQDFSGVLGRWSFDQYGDTSITDMTFYVVKNGNYLALGVFQ